MANDWWFQIIVEFGATFTGTALGFYLNFLYERRKNLIEETKIKIRILTAIKGELNSIIEWLGPREIFHIDEDLPLITHAFESAVNGGYFSSFDTETQNKLSNVYSDIIIVKKRLEELMIMYAQGIMTSISAERRENIHRGINERFLNLTISIPKLVEYINHIINEYEAELPPSSYSHL